MEESKSEIKEQPLEPSIPNENTETKISSDALNTEENHMISEVHPEPNQANDEAQPEPIQPHEEVPQGGPEQPNVQDELAPEPESQGNIIWRATKWIGIHIYNIAYATGGFLADLFGITSPRYGYVLREYEEIQRRQAKREREAAYGAGTVTPDEENVENTDQFPTAVNEA